MRTKVLYVDDEPANLTVFRRQFQDMEVRTASSGLEALQILESEEIPVLLTDQRMPKMSGAELVAEVRRRHPDVVRLVVTAYADFDAVVRSINEGHVARYVKKPWSVQELRSVILGANELYWATKQNRLLTEDLLHKKRLGAVAGIAEELTAELESIGRAFAVVDHLDRATPNALADLDLACAAVERLSRIIDDLRQFSKRSSFDRSSVTVEDLNVLVERAVELLRLFPAVRALASLEVELSPRDLPVAVDARRLSQLLVNLILNLVSDGSAPSGKLLLRTRAEETRALISFLGDGMRLSLDAISALSTGPRATPPPIRGAVWLLLAQRVLADYGGELALRRQEQEVGVELSLPIR